MRMSEKYGKRFVCFKCGCKFYDLHKPLPICPKCGANQEQAPKGVELEMDEEKEENEFLEGEEEKFLDLEEEYGEESEIFDIDNTETSHYKD